MHASRAVLPNMELNYLLLNLIKIKQNFKIQFARNTSYISSSY